MDNRVDELIHEVEEQLKWERLEKIWKDYGTFIVAGFLAIILGVGGYAYWNHSVLQKQYELSEKYTTALNLSQDGKKQEALDILKTISDDASGYGMLANFLSAATLLENPETKPQAVAIYRDIINKRVVDYRYRNLAIIFLVQAEIDTGDAAELTALLKETEVGTNMWPDTTAELSALLAIKSGNFDSARLILQELKDSKSASQGSVQRAKALLQTLPQTK
jgi:hypothetical protein